LQLQIQFSRVVVDGISVAYLQFESGIGDVANWKFCSLWNHFLLCDAAMLSRSWES